MGGIRNTLYSGAGLKDRCSRCWCLRSALGRTKDLLRSRPRGLGGIATVDEGGCLAKDRIIKKCYLSVLRFG